MKSIKSRYSLLQIQNNKLYQEIITGDTIDIRGDKGNPGFIYAPYILMESPPILIDGYGKYWERIIQVRKRREKIEKIRSKFK